MSLLALALARDPSTPAAVLDAVRTAQPGTADLLTLPGRAHVALATHPNLAPHTPAEVFDDGDALLVALDNPAATPGTRTRVVRVATTSALIDALESPAPAAWERRADLRATLVAELAARVTDDTAEISHLEHLERVAAAVTLLGDPDAHHAQVAALTRILTHLPDAQELPRRADLRLLVAAAHHPASLADFAKVAATHAHRDPWNLAEALRRLARIAADGEDPLAAQTGALVHAAREDGSPRAWADTVTATGNPDVAEMALTRCPTRSVLEAVAHTPALAQTDVARRAQLALIIPLPDIPAADPTTLPHDIRAAIAALARRWNQLMHAMDAPHDVTEDVMVTIAGALLRGIEPADSRQARVQDLYAARAALHPASAGRVHHQVMAVLPALLHRAQISSTADAAAPAVSPARLAAARLSVATAVAGGGDPADLPLPLLTAASSDPVIAMSLAHRLTDATRALHAHPGAVAAALHLELTFTGTTTDLVTTAIAVASTT